MCSLKGNENAATAAAPATTAAKVVARSDSSEQVKPSKASTPAKPRPHSVGITSASTMPATDGNCHAAQFTALPPRKYSICPSPSRGSWNRLMKRT